MAVLQEKYKWKHMKQDVENYLQQCPECASDSIARNMPAPPLRPIISRNILERVQVDFTFLHRDPKTGDDCILTMIDTYSKFAWAKACTSKHAAHVAQFLYETFMNEGYPLIIQSDNGKEFINQIMEKLRELLGTRQIKSAPRHPQTNGQIERFNQTLKKRIKKLTGSKARAPWAHLLPVAVCLYNKTVHSAHHRRPMDVYRALVPRPTDEESTLTPALGSYNLMTYLVVDFEAHAKFAAELQQEVTKALEETAEKEIKRYEKKYRVVVHQPGDYVLVDKGVKNKNRQEVKLLPAIIVEGLEYGAYTVEWLSGINKGKLSDEDCHLIRPDPKATQNAPKQLEITQISQHNSNNTLDTSPNKKKRKFDDVYEDLQLPQRSAPLKDIVVNGINVVDVDASIDDSEPLEASCEHYEVLTTRSDTHQWKLICEGVMPLPKRRRL